MSWQLGEPTAAPAPSPAWTSAFTAATVAAATAAAEVVLLDDMPSPAPLPPSHPPPSLSRDDPDVIVLDTPPQHPTPPPRPETIFIDDSPCKRRRTDSPPPHPLPASTRPNSSPVIVVDDDDNEIQPLQSIRPVNPPEHIFPNRDHILAFDYTPNNPRRLTSSSHQQPAPPLRLSDAIDDIITTSVAGPRLRPTEPSVPRPRFNPPSSDRPFQVHPVPTIDQLPALSDASRSLQPPARRSMPDPPLLWHDAPLPTNPTPPPPAPPARSPSFLSPLDPDWRQTYHGWRTNPRSRQPPAPAPAPAPATAPAPAPAPAPGPSTSAPPQRDYPNLPDLDLNGQYNTFFHAVQMLSEREEPHVTIVGPFGDRNIPTRRTAGAVGPSGRRSHPPNHPRHLQPYAPSIRRPPRSSVRWSGRHMANSSGHSQPTVDTSPNLEQVHALNAINLSQRVHRGAGNSGSRARTNPVVFETSADLERPHALEALNIAQRAMGGSGSRMRGAGSDVRHGFGEPDLSLRPTRGPRGFRRAVGRTSAAQSAGLGMGYFPRSHHTMRAMRSSSTHSRRAAGDPSQVRASGSRRRSSTPYAPTAGLHNFFAVVGSPFDMVFQGERLDYEHLIRLDEQLMRDKNRADKSQIDSLPIVKASAEDKEIRCCVCMCDVEEGEELRVLPCSHKYHRKCIDEWLTYNGCCPVDKKRIAPPRSRRRCSMHRA